MELTIEVFDAGAWTDAAIIDVTGATKGGVSVSCTFEYTWDYAFNKANHDKPVSLNYPVNADLIRKNEWPAFLYDIVPQGNGRRFLLATLNRSITEGASADFELLRSGAFNPIGYLRVKEAVQFYQTYIERHQNDNLHVGMQLEDIIGRHADFVERMHIYGMLTTGTTGIQGVAPKFLLTQDKAGLWYADGQIEDHRAAQHWIIKLPRGHHPDDLKVIKNEVGYLKTAKMMGLRIAQEVELRGNMLFVKRFDRRVSKAHGFERLHQESLASIAGVVGFDVRPTQFELLAALRSVATDRTKDTIEFLKRDVLNLAMRNTDNHARNTAVQVVDDIVQLTPLYDFAPMYLDPEMIPRAARWYHPLTGKELEDWKSIILAIDWLPGEQVLIIEALLAFAQTMERLPEMMLEAGVDQDVVQFLRLSIVGQRLNLLQLESLLG